MNERPREDVIRKLRAILAKTEEAGCSENEARIAMAMASRFMAEHNLSMEEITKDAGEAQEAWLTGEAATVGSRWTLEHNIAYFVVKEFFFVEGVITQRSEYDAKLRLRTTKTLRLFGKSSNVEAGKWAFQALLDAFDRLFADYRKRTKAPATDRRAFVAGVAQGFAQKMRDERAALAAERDLELHAEAACNPNGAAALAIRKGGTELAIRSIERETADEFKKAHPKLGKSRSNFSEMRDSGGALEAGRQAGRSLNLNRQVGSASNTKGLPGR